VCSDLSATKTEDDHNLVDGFSVRVNGLVQGVGFRPFVWRLAHDFKVAGSVCNDASGVKIELLITELALAGFLQRLQEELPPLARIDQVAYEPARYLNKHDFTIEESEEGEVSTGCVPDAATCAVCTQELFDPDDRRFRYPFINCTHCGPRLSIIRQIPYDRASTTMASFIQCPECHEEYTDPNNRRFHAQPNACSVCGPQAWLEGASGEKLQCDDIFLFMAGAIKAGKIIALKGLGGFHLACDATNQDAVATLRARKQRPEKPFALMVRDSAVLGSYVEHDDVSLALLRRSEAPVVLMNRTEAEPVRALASNVAPGQYQLGMMLPYTPIHQLLMETLDMPLIMTSGNRSGAPQAISNEDARLQLKDIADLMLMHDRPIQNRVDDSVVRQVGGQIHFLRRARGYAPGLLDLPPGFEKAPDLIALGAELKNTLCLIQNGRAVLSQHLGDLEDARTYDEYQRTLALYQNLYQHKANLFACDLHPEYLSSSFAEQLASEGADLIKVQHHHAHLASCLGDNNYPLDGEAVLAICLDGTGYGLDGTLWGGEFLLGNYRQVERLACLKPFPLIGGTQAIREPWRCLFAQLKQALPALDLDMLRSVFPVFEDKPCLTLERMMEKQLNCPQTSSAGRLFDAVAAALGCHADAISYEGQAAIELETLARQGDPATPAYSMALDISNQQIDPAPLWTELFHDLASGQRCREDMALAFHHGFVRAIVDQVQSLNGQHRFSTIALSGGVMQNELLFGQLSHQLQSQGFQVLTHRRLPANDGGLAFGQALVAAAGLISVI